MPDEAISAVSPKFPNPWPESMWLTVVDSQFAIRGITQEMTKKPYNSIHVTGQCVYSTDRHARHNPSFSSLLIKQTFTPPPPFHLICIYPTNYVYLPAHHPPTAFSSSVNLFWFPIWLSQFPHSHYNNSSQYFFSIHIFLPISPDWRWVAATAQTFLNINPFP